MVKLFACGVNEYRGEIDLPFCVNDSLAFCEAFKENLIINPKDIYVAADNGNISNIEYCKALKVFCEEATEKDTYVYTDQIINFLMHSKAKSKVVILDCCHSDVGEKFMPPIDEETVVEKFYATGITGRRHSFRYVCDIDGKDNP